ncbi:hypothetical protein AB0I68_10125 [Streptomyces sp. NPDC050448]|uniref:hypothetical protein n=1 Tax=Streptomyces sp. NPDC050448 TaxID=3155404 RepID=UPI0034220EDF
MNTRQPLPPRHRSLLPLTVLAALIALVGAVLFAPAPTRAAAGAADYKQGVTAQGAGPAQIRFTPATPAAPVDVHYLPGGGPGRQNFRMADNGPAADRRRSGLRLHPRVLVHVREGRTAPRHTALHR